MFTNPTGYILKDDEYMNEQGIPFCKTCKTPRMILIKELGNNWVATMCNCKRREWESLENKRKIEERVERYKKLMNSSLIGERFKSARFDKIDIKRPQDFLNALEKCKSYVANWEAVKKNGQGFYIFGNCGTGKTLLTACIGNALMDNLVPVMFSSVIDLSKRLRALFANQDNDTEQALINRIASIDLLIIDDIGAEELVRNGQNTFMQDRIYDIVNLRYENRKPTIFSSNYSMEQLQTQRGFEERTLDRMNEMATVTIELRGNSYRDKVQSETKAVF